MAEERVLARGLEGVIAGRTSNSKVEGEQGILIYRGYDVDELAPNASYEEVLWLLWHGELPDRNELGQLSQRLGGERDLPDPVYELLRAAPKMAHPMSILQAATALLGVYDPETQDTSAEAKRRMALRVVAKSPTIVALIDRFRRNEDRLEPRPDLSQAASFLYLLHGEVPSEMAERALNKYWVLTIDHGFGNASTFTGRVIASTQSDLYSAVAGAVGALKGPAHGGAPTDVLDVLQEIKTPARVDGWVRQRLAAGGRIPGLGHRVYRTWDPRVKHLKEVSAELAAQAPDPELFELAQALEETGIAALRKEHPEYAWTNVEFYTATLLHYIGIPGYLFASMFAASRVGGWTAHVLEAFGDRLIRPRGEYIGPRGRHWVPIEER